MSLYVAFVIYISGFPMASLKIGTFNVGGVHSPAKQKKFLLHLNKLKVDIAFLQETHLLPPEVVKLGTLGWKVLASASYSSKARGVTILTKSTREVPTHTTVVDPQGRYVIADVTVDKSRLILCNIYAPNSNSSDYFLQLIIKLCSFGDIPVVLGGDYNIVSSPKMDRAKVSRTMGKQQKVGIPYIMKNLHVIDVWRSLNPLEREYTCLSAAHGTLSRIDYLLVSETLFPRILETHIEPISLSDHALCWFKFSLQLDRGTHRQWRFPSHLSNSAKFWEALENSWLADNKHHTSTTPLLFWQAPKAVLRGNILSYTAHRDNTLRIHTVPHSKN